MEWLMSVLLLRYLTISRRSGTGWFFFFSTGEQKSYQGKQKLTKNIITKTFLCYILYASGNTDLPKIILLLFLWLVFIFMQFSPLLLLKVNNNISIFLGWVLVKHRSGLPHCLKVSGRSGALSRLAGRQMDRVVAVFPQEGNSGKENSARKGISFPEIVPLPGNVPPFPIPVMWYLTVKR